MCEFLSWVEKGDKVYFLTSKFIHDTPRGEIVKKRFPGEGELSGHAAIRAYFDLEGGRERECTDFKSPANFPAEIVEALKAGGFRTFPMPEGLLCAALYADCQAKSDALYADYQAKSAPLSADYHAKRDPLYADYRAKCASLDADYHAKLDALYADYHAKRDPLYADYQAKCASLDADYHAKLDAPYADYQAKCAPLYADYQAKCASLDADYHAKLDALYAWAWELFTHPENRVKEWI